MNLSSIGHTIKLGFKSLMLHKLRSALTVLGIIFGVCSVITMLAVGEGASYEAQERIKTLGSNNIIIETVKPSDEEEEQDNRVLKYGITYRDLDSMQATLPGVEKIAPMRLMNETATFLDAVKPAQLIGTDNSYAQIKQLNITKGRFLCQLDETQKSKVCVVSSGLADQLFTFQNPLEHNLKIKGVYYQVVGIINEQGEGDNRKASRNIYIPLATMKNRYGDMIIKSSSGSFSAESVELHKLIVQMKSPEAVLAGESQVNHLLTRFHTQNDFKLTVPLQLLKEAEETKRMFNIVLGSIAAISLLVGGIGIMNIMLATVTERTREIGLRRALGARKGDIISQFMVEAVLLSVCGGAAGILLGVIAPQLIAKFTDMNAIVSSSSVVLAFLVSALVGIIFGIYPAAKSAQLDPIEALRND